MAGAPGRGLELGLDRGAAVQSPARMSPFRLDPRWAHACLRWASHHTGLPVVLVAAVALVVTWRLLKRGVRLAVEVALALALLVAATRLGWLRW